MLKIGGEKLHIANFYFYFLGNVMSHMLNK